MDFAPVYLVQRLFFRIGSFFYHWYVGGSRVIGNKYMATLATMDESFAVGITLRHFSEPLYRDYSVIGRILGVVFRTGRILIGGIVYLFITIIFGVAYLAWLAVPALLVWGAIKGSITL
jgi:hypothetical protein